MEWDEFVELVQNPDKWGDAIEQLAEGMSPPEGLESGGGGIGPHPGSPGSRAEYPQTAAPGGAAPGALESFLKGAGSGPPEDFKPVPVPSPIASPVRSGSIINAVPPPNELPQNPSQPMDTNSLLQLLMKGGG